METEKYTTQQPSIGTQSGQLLSAEQRAFCEQIAVGENLDSRRALALLIVDDGATQEDAAQQAGLTLYQVKYCLVRFRKLGVTMFPDAPTTAAQPAPAPAPETDSEPVPHAIAGETLMISEVTDEKPDNKPAKGNKRKKKNKDMGRKKKSGKSSKKKGKKKGAKNASKGKGRKKNRKSKSGKSSGNMGKKKNKR